MLPFGSITSIIPLFVLAIGYLLFAGASLLNKINPRQAGIPDKVIVVKAASPDNSKQPSISFHKIIPDNSCAENGSDPVYIPKNICISFIGISPELLYSGYPNCLFSRPPPALFS